MFSIFSKKIERFSNVTFIGILVVIVAVVEEQIPFEFKVYANTISHLIREILMFILPFMVLPLIIHSFIDIKSNGGVYFILGLLLIVFLSNFFAIMLPYLVIKTGSFVNAINIVSLNTANQIINPQYSLNLPNVMTVYQAVIFGMIAGIYLSYNPIAYCITLINFCYKYSRMGFEKIFIKILPIYVFGILLKLMHEIDITTISIELGKLIILIYTLMLSYIICLFIIGKGGSIIKAIQAIKNAIPAAVVALTTMSSLITMPVTIKAAEKNTSSPHLARLIISTTANIHVIGDCICLSAFALIMIYSQNTHLPDLSVYTYFAFILSLAQFAAVSIPGGSITIILPILITQFNFTDEMASFIVALSICIDPFNTAGNVMGNSAFVTIIDRLYIRPQLLTISKIN